ncbi:MULTISPECIES: hypothetical protein [Streptomyces]|uniref:hypothetical protein n=1 Tax=Streptomyces TaxID=1883 RepID=UPI0004CC5CAA|nr:MULTISPECIES: hypothetical protein [Streptomyces]NDZ69311.1 hypothetical protein [Streptomyces cyaneofuscatus]ONI49521.1 hypothetical protein STIB_61920 [Streptomyces sp. IB2014 011-1]RDV47252.1 hypothetical protein DDV98_34905 [Streptomyces sp. IB2014 011-12]
MHNGEDGMGTGPGDLRRGVGALETFKKRVDALLADLEGSAAGKSKVAAQKVSRASLSGPNARFAEADGLYTQYNRVHESLISLSKSLGDQIEYLSLGVHAAAVGFDNVDDETRRRFHEIQTRMDREREEAVKQKQRSDDDQFESGWGAK